MTPIYTNLIPSSALPEWEAKAAAQGQVLDYWPLYPDRDDLVAVRFVGSADELDEARASRYLGLDPRS